MQAEEEEPEQELIENIQPKVASAELIEQLKMKFSNLVNQTQSIGDIVRANNQSLNSQEQRKFATRLMMDALQLKQDAQFLEMKQQQFDVEIKLI